MALWAGGQSRRLVHALRSKLWLLVSEDPGRERMVELVRLFDPSARSAGAGRISVDAQRRIYLARPTAVGPDTAAEAQAPLGLPVAYFVQVQGRAAPLDMTGIERERQKLIHSAILLLNGLAVRLGGSAWPSPKELSEALAVKVYMPKPLAAAEVFSLAAPFVAGLTPEENVTLGSVGASMWRTADGTFELEFWPGEAAVVMTVDPPVALGEWQLHPEHLDCAVLRLADPANRADPAAARMVGQLALTLAAATGGVGIDPLQFRISQADDLLFR